MTEITYKKTKVNLVFLLSAVVLVGSITKLSYIHVGAYVYLDLSIIPAAVIVMLFGYKHSLIWGALWGLTSCFTHPLAAAGYYAAIFISQVAFSFCIVYARKLSERKNLFPHKDLIVLFGLAIHSLIFDVGLFSLLNIPSWDNHVPYGLILVKVCLTMFFYYMTLSFISRQLKEVHVSNRLKRSEM